MTVGLGGVGGELSACRGGGRGRARVPPENPARLETLRNGQCLLDAVLASKASTGDAVILQGERYERGSDVALRYHMMDLLEVHAWDPIPVLYLGVSSLGALVRQLFGCSVEAYLRRGRTCKVGSDGRLRFYALDSVALAVLAVFDRSAYVVRDGSGTATVARFDRRAARTTTTVLFEEAATRVGVGHFWGVSEAAAAARPPRCCDLITPSAVEIVVGGGLSLNQADQLPDDWDDVYRARSEVGGHDAAADASADWDELWDAAAGERLRAADRRGRAYRGANQPSRRGRRRDDGRRAPREGWLTDPPAIRGGGGGALDALGIGGGPRAWSGRGGMAVRAAAVLGSKLAQSAAASSRRAGGRVRRSIPTLRGGGDAAVDVSRGGRPRRKRASDAVGGGATAGAARRSPPADDDGAATEGAAISAVTASTPEPSRADDAGREQHPDAPAVGTAAPLGASAAAERALRGKVTRLPVGELKLYQNYSGRQLVGRLVHAETYDGAKAPSIARLIVADSTGDVLITMFNQAVLYDRLRVGSIYYISLEGAQVRPASKYSRAHMPVEITLSNAEIHTAVATPEGVFPLHPYVFTAVSELLRVQTGARVDVLGAVVSVSAVTSHARKGGGANVWRQVLEISDGARGDTEAYRVSATCFGDEKGHEVEVGTVVALRGVVERRDGLTALAVWPGGLALASSLAEAEPITAWWRSNPPTPSTLPPCWHATRLDALRDVKVGTYVDFAGAVLGAEVRRGGANPLRRLGGVSDRLVLV